MLVLPRGLWWFFSWMIWLVIPLRLLLKFVCFRSEHAAAEITFSKAQIHLLESQWPNERFDVCVPWQSAGLWEKMGAQKMFEQGMFPTLMLLDTLHDLFEDRPSFFSCWMPWHKCLDVQRGLLWPKALWKGSPLAQLLNEFLSPPQLQWQQPVSPWYFLASVPSQ